MQKAYVFENEKNATMFYKAASHLGCSVELHGNTVLGEQGTLKTVTDHYTVYEEQAPIWTNDKV